MEGNDYRIGVRPCKVYIQQRKLCALNAKNCPQFETAKVGTLAVRKIAMGKIAGKMLDVIILIFKKCDVICVVFQNMKK